MGRKSIKRVPAATATPVATAATFSAAVPTPIAYSASSMPLFPVGGAMPAAFVPIHTRTLRQSTADNTAASTQAAAGRRANSGWQSHVTGDRHPAQERDATHRREPMGDGTTLASLSHDPTTTPARLVRMSRFLAKRGNAKGKRQAGRPKPRGLKALGLSRNHIVADSSVAVLVRAAVANQHVQNDPARMHDFLATLGGHRGDAAVAAFVEAQAHHAGGRLNLATAARRRATNNASMGSGNLRIDDAGRNTRILHGFDHELDEMGRPTQRSADVHAALRGLLRYPGMRRHVLRAGRPTIADRRFLSSSSRASIDMQDPGAFEPRPDQPRRRNSIG